jgi:curved DNA-binding protein CbpA
VQGQLGEKLVPDLIREIGRKNASGLLRISRGSTIKAIFFESGTPTFAISNLTSEQLDHKLVKEGLVTFEQVERAKERAVKAHRLGPALVEMGQLEDGQMRKAVRDQVMGIVLSLFELTEGDYSFDERIRAAHEVTLGLSSADILLLGARHAVEIPQMADALVPRDRVVLRSKLNGIQAESGQLIPLESYILSRIESPTAVDEIGALSGLAEDDAHRAVCALVAAGFLRVLGIDPEAESEPALEADDSSNRLREEVARTLHFSTSADFYEILGVSRQAGTAEIKTAYYQLAKKYHPDRHHQRDNDDLRGKLENLFALITQAYDTLSQPAARAAYDEKIRRASGTLATGTSRTTTAPATEPVNEQHPHKEDQSRNGDSGAIPRQPAASGSTPPASGESQATEAANSARKGGPQLPPGQMAEFYYQQGRARFERKEYHAAVHLLREAIKLDASRAPYHYHLGIALIRNPRTRRDAELHLSKAAELEPYNSQIRVKLGLLYKEAGLFKRADHYFREALQMDPDNRVAKREMGLQAAKSKAESGSIWKSDVGTIAKKIFKK